MPLRPIDRGDKAESPVVIAKSYITEPYVVGELKAAATTKRLSKVDAQLYKRK